MVPNTKDYHTEMLNYINKVDKAKESALNTQVGGEHYRHFPIQPIVFTHVNQLNDIQSAVIWYLCRYNLKGNALKDLQKAKHFIDILIELEGLNDKETDGIDYDAELAKLCGVDKD